MYNVITIDDEYMIHKSLKKIIESANHHFKVVGEAEDGKQALVLLEAYSPDVVITDICMPEMDGLEFIREAKQRNPLIKFIIISGYNNFDYAQKAIRFGVSDFLLKPIEPDQVLSTLHKIYNDLETNKHRLTDQNEWLLESKSLQQQLAEQVWLLDESKAMKILDDIHQHFLQVHAESVPLNQLAAELIASVEQEIEKRNFRFKLIYSKNTKWSDQPDLFTLYVKPMISAMIKHIRGSRNLGSRQNILKAVQYMEEHYLNPDLSLQEVADSVGMSIAYFSRSFKEEMNISFVQHLIKLRMEKAKSLLEDPNFKTVDIAYHIGYSDYPHFSKTYKKNYGISPSEYRKQLRIQE
jgi:two-component system response regulator YesN